MPKKGKVVYLKPITDHNKLQFDILEIMKKEKKPTPDMIFEGYNKPKMAKQNKNKNKKVKPPPKKGK